MTDKQVVVDITIAAPIDAVWDALRDPQKITQWFGWDAPSLAEEIKFIFIDGAVADDEAHVLQFGEWEGSSDAIVLSGDNGGTRLQLLRTGGAVLDWTGRYDDIAEGWVTFFQQLRFALERHPAEARRTIHLSGPSLPGVAEPAAELGISPARTLAPGAAWSAMLAPGDQADGVVWYQTTYQTALSVRHWGDGLLVVTDMGVSPKRPHGGGSVLLTTYGLSEDSFAALEQRWTQWWAAHYPKPSE